MIKIYKKIIVMSLQVETLTVGQLQTNCYLLVDTETDKAVIVDPGDDAEFIIQKVLDQRVEVESILATHGHFDHVLAANELKLAFNAPFLMHSKDLFLLERMRETTKHFAGFDPGPPPAVDESLDDSTHFGFGSVVLEVLHTPGHTPGSVSFFDKDNHTLFVGDVVFAGGAVGRTDFAYCSHAQLSKSINKLFMLPDQTLVHAGHDRDFYLSDEKMAHSKENK